MPVRVDLDPAELPGRDFYRLLNSVVVPRPIAWVSTLSAEGVGNLAPHSFFTVACVDPPVIQFTSVGSKDSLRNVEETRELVVCLAPESLFEQVNGTGTNFPAGADEFAEVGLEREASLRVWPPRVAASPVALECVLQGTVSFRRLDRRLRPRGPRRGRRERHDRRPSGDRAPATTRTAGTQRMEPDRRDATNRPDPARRLAGLA